MPLVIVFLALLAAMAVAVIMLPLTIVARYRAGTARRVARRWVATINLYGVMLSALIFLGLAAVSSFWVPRAFTYASIGLVTGGALGLLGLVLTKWEITPSSMHFTPSRWLTLSITLIVAARLAFGFWRAWQTWQTVPEGESWLVASGVAGSIGAGGVVIGYYLLYWMGVRRRIGHFMTLRG